MALKWKDKCDVLMIYQTVSVKVTGGHVNKVKPISVQKYNSYMLGMLGIDKSDQMLQYYCFNQKIIKWWKKVMLTS